MTELQLFNETDCLELHALAEKVRWLNLNGHNPATSGNYSLRSSTDPNYAYISESGINKAEFMQSHFIPINIHTLEVPDIADFKAKKVSDETAVHMAIYRATNAQCVLHTHMIESLLFADLFPQKSFAKLSQLELLKGLEGITTHDTEIEIPLFENTQDIHALGFQIEPILQSMVKKYGLILRGHGMYVWGSQRLKAERHLEVFSYLFQYCLRKRELYGHTL